MIVASILARRGRTQLTRETPAGTENTAVLVPHVHKSTHEASWPAKIHSVCKKGGKTLLLQIYIHIS